MLLGSAAQSTFALVKKLPSNIPALKLSPQSRLHSFEIFNPETEDIDTDSSTGTGASTPDSVGSVISVRIENSNGTPVTGTLIFFCCFFLRIKLIHYPYNLGLFKKIIFVRKPQINIRLPLNKTKYYKEN